MSRTPEKIAMHHADSNAKHESFLAMHCLTFSGYRSLLARKVQRLHCAMLTARCLRRRSGAFLRCSGWDGIAARQIVRPGAIAQVLNGLQEIGILSPDRRQLD